MLRYCLIFFPILYNFITMHAAVHRPPESPQSSDFLQSVSPKATRTCLREYPHPSSNSNFNDWHEVIEFPQEPVPATHAQNTNSRQELSSQSATPPSAPRQILSTQSTLPAAISTARDLMLLDKIARKTPRHFTDDTKNSLVNPRILELSFFAQAESCMRKKLPDNTGISGNRSNHIYVIRPPGNALFAYQVFVYIFHRILIDENFESKEFHDISDARKWVIEQIKKDYEPPCCC